MGKRVARWVLVPVLLACLAGLPGCFVFRTAETIVSETVKTTGKVVRGAL